jgi:hypothetical protein
VAKNISDAPSAPSNVSSAVISQISPGKRPLTYSRSSGSSAIPLHAFGDSEVIVVMVKSKSEPAAGRYTYRLLATNKTSTMEKELQDAGTRGFDYKDQTIFGSAFGGEEVVAILERDRDAGSGLKYEYRVLATNKTSTMQKELQDAGTAGFKFVGVTISKTAFGGKEVVSILRKETGR